MDLTHPITLLLPVGIAALVVWRVHSRIKRMVGRQRLSRVRPWPTVVLFPLLLALLLFASVDHPEAAGALLGGVLLGCALAWYGLRLTKFEVSPIGLFYTPNAHLGVALSLLLIGRLAYRAVQVYAAHGSFHADSGAFARSPLTLVIFGTLAGYYVAYAAGLLRWKHRVQVGGPAAAGERRSLDRRRTNGPAMKQAIEKENASAVAAEIGSRLRAFNEDQAGPLNHQRVVLSVRDDDGTLLAGLSADLHWHCMYLDLLWVEPQHRKKGLGSSLLRQAEGIAKERSCEVIYLSTFQFQAPEFYAKHGYSLFGELHGVPPNSSRQWFSKVLR